MDISNIKRQAGISYLGGCNSSKLIKSKDRNVMTYGIYLAPYDLSGYNVCPESEQCKKYCLYGSGRNKIELIANEHGGNIQMSRIKKTKLFFEDRRSFMKLLIHEIKQNIKRAEEKQMRFAVRLNCTSDICLDEFNIDDQNILEIFPEVQFYDYTKVYKHIALSEKYKNYDLTFSYSGTNWTLCEILLNKGYRVAVVFEDHLPKEFRGFPVIDANKHDARYLDDGGIVCGLSYKKVANNYIEGKFQRPDAMFVIKETEREIVSTNSL